ncbi:MAG: L-threonylcarbamoyladenylate synthase [bacterium]
MDYYKLTENNISENVLEHIIHRLNNGAVIGYPAETVYGLGCDALNVSAVKRIYQLKGRDYSYPMIVLVKDKSMVNELTSNIPEVAEKVMNEFWPGPLTIIFKASPKIPDILIGGGKTIGVRISSDPVCKTLIEKFKNPLVSTSANPTGYKPATSVKQLTNYFKSEIDLVIDSGSRNRSAVSTVLNLSSDIPEIKREGAINKSQIYRVIEINNE